MSSGPPIEVRPIANDDAEAVAHLSSELGYPTDAVTMLRRIGLVTASADHAAFVACQAARVVGWIHVAAVHHMQAEPRAEIGGLVVAAQSRSSGVGKQLVARAEQWARETGLSSVVVRSQIMREAAHRFYLREGYSRTKTSAVFSKTLLDEKR